MIEDRLADLYQLLDDLARVAVAVSGGVDSVTLAAAAHRRLGERATMYHAVSPAVPPEATERTRRHATQSGWRLEVIEAGEFSDPEYLRNPVNRCFHCKSHLYAAISNRTDSVIASGTNVDDLADFRPGLDAAKNYRVRHPYVEAGIDKAAIRAIAAHFGLSDIAELPASPCLSSRIETGIRVNADDLGLVHAVERLVTRVLEPDTVRCRVRREGLVIELDEQAYRRAISAAHSDLPLEIERIGSFRGHAEAPRFACYERGSAFLRDA